MPGTERAVPKEETMIDMARVWPIIIQYGVGAILGGVGIWCGIRSHYLDPDSPEDRRLVRILVGGYLVMLALVCFFTFVAPFLSRS